MSAFEVWSEALRFFVNSRFGHKPDGDLMLSLDPPSFDLGLEQIYKSSEGIDLAGNELKRAFIGTLGTPQFNLSNKHVRSVMQEKFGDGNDVTHTYPNIRKVIQSAGRVNRKTSDKG